MNENYKPNSYRSREAEQQQQNNTTQRKIEKVVSGPVTIKKKSGLQKFADGFIQDDLPKLKDHVLFDIVIPSTKKAIVDIIETIFWGDGRRGGRSSLPGSKVSYGSFYNRSQTNDRPSRPTSNIRNDLDYDDVEVDSAGDAELVLDSLNEIIATYGFARVADLYELVGISTHNQCANNYGWTNLSTAGYQRNRYGDKYVLKLPRALPID